METKKKVDDILRMVKREGFPAICIHGDKSQQERDFVLGEFRSGKCHVLIATDVAARGNFQSSLLYLLIIFCLVFILRSVKVMSHKEGVKSKFDIPGPVQTDILLIPS